MTPADLCAAAIGFALALPVGTLTEYLIHRFVLHSRWRSRITRRHRMHHKANDSDTLWGDFRDFLPGLLPVGWLGFLWSPAVGVGFLLGGAVYVFVLALVHKLSHERPELVFWMRDNAHALHHGTAPRSNFGVVTRFWDRVFGTCSDGTGHRHS
jgi:sterol desaturase/sphingolipid hydroxylase (fatty acid hydroxylase superfamily)